MKVPKIVEAARAMALENLVPPEITVVTRDKTGHVQLWWMDSKSYDPASLGMRAYDVLSLSKAGHWLVPSGMEARIKVKSLGQDIAAGNPFCRRFSVLERRKDSNFANLDEKEFTNSSFVSGILKEIFNGTYQAPAVVPEQDTNPVDTTDNLEIKTFYKVDGMEFDTLAAAQAHVKAVKIFDEYQKVDPESDYMTLQAVIEAMVADPNKYIAILQWK